jgi:hypothetical protein
VCVATQDLTPNLGLRSSRPEGGEDFLGTARPDLDSQAIRSEISEEAAKRPSCVGVASNAFFLLVERYPVPMPAEMTKYP